MIEEQVGLVAAVVDDENGSGKGCSDFRFDFVVVVILAKQTRSKLCTALNMGV